MSTAKIKRRKCIKETPSAHFVTRDLSQKEKLQDTCEILIQFVSSPVCFVPNSMKLMMVSTNMKSHIHTKISDIHVMIVNQNSNYNFNFYHIHTSTTVKKKFNVLSVSRNIQVSVQCLPIWPAIQV